MKDILLQSGLGLLIATICFSCGFKSDLYLPGQPDKVEQYDSESLKTQGEKKLLQLEKQNGLQTSDKAGSKTVNPDQGVVVDLPLEDEINRVKSELRKKVAEKK